MNEKHEIYQEENEAEFRSKATRNSISSLPGTRPRPNHFHLHGITMMTLSGSTDSSHFMGREVKAQRC